MRHQARLPFQYEEQRSTNIADIRDQLPTPWGHQVTIIEKIIDLPLSEGARIRQGSQEIGQVLAVLLLIGRFSMVRRCVINGEETATNASQEVPS